VALYPSHPDGVEFLTKYNAWGFIRINQTPRYFALYVSQPFSEIQYIGEVEDVIDPAIQESPAVGTQHPSYEAGKRVVTLKQGRLWKLAEPITYGPPARGKAPQGLQYHPMSKLANAVTLDDLKK